MRKYLFILLTLFAFMSVLSACDEDIVIPDPEGPYVPIPDPDTLDPEYPLPLPDTLTPDNPLPLPDTLNPDTPTDSIPTPTPTDPIPVPGNGTVPGPIIGNWVQGTFSLTEFWNYDGSYAGKGTEQANVFVFGPNGECEYYFIMTTRIYNCTSKVFNYRKGTVVFDEANGSFTFTPASGNYRGFYSCAPSSNFSRDATPEELVPKTYYYQMEDRDGTPYMVVRSEPGSPIIHNFMKTVW